PRLENLNPETPSGYQSASHIPVPDILLPVWRDYRVLAAADAAKSVGQTLPSVSVVIPLYGGERDIATCLTSLEDSLDLLHEVIVVDDCSSDKAVEVTRQFPFVKLFENGQRRGFAYSCNFGAQNA